MKVYYPNSDGIIVNEVFAFKDAHGNDLTDLDTFKANAMVKVILNTTDHTAYIQNADTNAYLESRFDGKADAADLANYLPLSGGNVTADVTIGKKDTNSYLQLETIGAISVRLPNGFTTGWDRGFKIVKEDVRGPIGGLQKIKKVLLVENQFYFLKQNVLWNA